MKTSGMWHITLSDTQKALVMAVIVGALTPVTLILQTQGFSLAHADWGSILDVALTGAFVGFVGYLAKNLVSDQNGKVFGRIG